MTTPQPDRPATPDVAALLDRWVEQGLLSGEQAAAIRTAEATAAPAPRPASLVGEALGYVGGVLVLVAAGTIAGRFWSGLGPGGQLAVLTGAALALLGAGTALPPRLGPPGQRLRAVCWLLGTGLATGALALLGEAFLDLGGAATTLLAGAGTAVLAGALWARHRGILQQAALVAALAVTAGAAAALLPHGNEQVVGLAVWGVGASWSLLSWARTGRDRVGVVCGATAAVVGSLLTLAAGWGTALALITAAGLVLAGVAARELVLLGVGALATLLVVPSLVARWFPDTLVAPVALLVTGAVLVAVALRVARGRGAPRPARTGRPVRPVVAGALAGAVALVVAATVLAMGAA